MDRHYIKSISIEGFRGINNNGNPIIIEFNTGGITSLFSPNGGGKSSIFDALSFTLNDELKCFKSLERENQDLKTIKNLFHTSDGKIIIELIDDHLNITKIEFKITENGIKEIVSPNRIIAESLINQIKDIHNFLDYNSFTDIINSSSENAGKTFLRLIGYERFSIIQDKLGQLVRNLERDYNINAKKAEIAAAEERIRISSETILEKLNENGIIVNKFLLNSICHKCERGIKKIVPDLPTLNFKEIEINEIIININSKEATFNVTKEALIRKNQEKELLISFQKKAKLFTSPKYKSIIKKLSHAYSVLTDEKEKYLGELFEIAIGTYNNFETLDKNTCLLCNTSNLGDKNNTFSSIIERRILKYKKFKEEYSNFKNSFKTLIDTCDLLTLENYLVSKNFITKKVISEFYYTNEIIDKQVFEDSKYPELLIFYLTILKDQTKLYEIEIKDLRKQIPEGLIAVIAKNGQTDHLTPV